MSICGFFKKDRSEPVQGGEQVPREVKEVFEQMQAHKMFNDPRYIAQIDYRINSRYPRLFVYDRTKQKLMKFKVAHGGGRPGDKNYDLHDGKCYEVSNESGSHLSSKGLIKCAETYYGSKGYSMRFDGLSPTNYAVRDRAVVMHDSSYVTDGNEHICGRSWGCAALSEKNSKKVIDMLKDGSPLLIVH